MARLFTALLFACVALLSFGSGAAQARSGELLSPTPCLRPVQDGQSVQDMLRLPESAFACTQNQRDLGAGDFWVRMDGFSITTEREAPLQFQMLNTWFEQVDFHFVYADGHIERRVLDNYGISDAIMPGDMITVDILPRPQPLVAIVAKVNGSGNMRGTMIAPVLVESQSAQMSNLLIISVYAAIGGICFALLIYNVALLWAMRQPFQLAYCAMLALTLAYCLVSSGGLAMLSESLSNTYRLKLTYVILGWLAAAAVLFLRYFVEEELLPRALRYALYAVAAVSAVGGTAFFLMAPIAMREIDSFMMIAMGANALIAIPFFATIIRKGSKYWPILLVAWLGPVGSAAARAINGFGLIPTNFIIDNSTLFGLAFEAIITSLAIGYRVRLMGQERDSAMQREKLAMVHADTDPLTSLLNRRAFLRRVVGSQGKWRLLIIDIDHFKGVNDRIGHVGGDDVLVAFAGLLRDYCPSNGVLARLGGEEFAIIFPVGEARHFREDELLRAIRTAKMVHELRVTASIGVAEGSLRKDEDWKALYRAADKALYRAKNAGRDRAVHSTKVQAVA